MTRRFIVFLAAAAVALALPSIALGEESSKEATPTYDLSFTLPTVGVSGCQVCHADPNLVKISGETTSSIYTDPAAFAETAHKDVICTGCHVDFAYKTPHLNAADEEQWREIAGNECKTCHQATFAEISSGSHTPATQPGVSTEQVEAERIAEGKPAQVPNCADCHGSHDIQYLDVERWETSGTVEVQEAAAEGAAEMHGKGLEICGNCHVDYAGAYADYYHGAAYQAGAPDAPACWDCHGAHEMLPASDKDSPVNPAHLVETCGRCHDDVNEEYVEYAQLIHGREEIESEVEVFKIFNAARDAIRGAVDTVASWFQGEA